MPGRCGRTREAAPPIPGHRAARGGSSGRGPPDAHGDHRHHRPGRADPHGDGPPRRGHFLALRPWRARVPRGVERPRGRSAQREHRKESDIAR
ncbi:hypothetical protein QJS66_23430 (plasmid) [Kocuria rhizophila]|nr:hypothetical protein QJS66_23430 [Kocuria rhizophila]